LRPMLATQLWMRMQRPQITFWDDPARESLVEIPDRYAGSRLLHNQ
jgi:hypothetical protein